jgi:hypothetical protein
MRPTLPLSVSITGALLVLGCASATRQAATQAPVLAQLPAFTAAGVPALGPAEIPVPPPTWKPQEPLASAPLPGTGLAAYPLLTLGEGDNCLRLIVDGKVRWTYQTGPGWEYDDAWILSNGNVAFTRMQYAAIVTPDKREVWRYTAPPGCEIHALQPLGRDRVLLFLCALPQPKVLVIDTVTGATVVEHAFDYPSQPGNPRAVHGQNRRIRLTAAGTYLIPWLSLGKVVEYDQDFREIWTYASPKPWAAIRLPDGNTLISDEKDQAVREITPQGATAWECRIANLPTAFGFRESQSCLRRANGNTILCSRGGHGNGSQLIEITRDLRVVNVVSDWRSLGPLTAVQVLDEPGIPEQPGDLLR